MTRLEPVLRASACVLALCLGAGAPASRAAEGKANAAAVAFTVEPPAGWSLASGAGSNPSLILALKGPEKSSFVLARINPVSLDNRAAVRSLLLGVLSGLNSRTRLKFKAAANLENATYANGLNAYTLRADLDDKPRLALAVMELDGVTMLGTLVSAVPETLLPSILGSLKGTGASVPGAVSLAESLDGQLSFRLPAGVRPRSLTPRERKQGFVVAFAGWDSELLVMKLADDATPVKDQPDIVKSTVLSYQGVDPKTLKPIQYLLTSAGPDFIYSSARVSEAAGEGLFVAGYMPWAYWGYSILAKGPKALDLIVGLFTSLSLGPSAVPKLVAASPRLPVARRVSLLTPGMSTLILALLAAAVVWFWWRNRGN